ncbi:MAG: ATP-binding protein [Candidatus Microbacterium phytovorans]|uniref:ATP-binding protein n=1 Tax=Candidatus Microbacterium phytovorans TaxID=3121374 RepID=A0AAJ5W0S8_9MICO|nr:ATP-binding protein [Microbacterium sp.]WEK13647.1 MAG: ATP-binding protein [Microbacterium sp.]
MAGVAEGLSVHLGAPLWAVRAFFVVTAGMLGAGVLLYLWCWAFMPWAGGEASPTRRAPVAWLLTVASTALVLTFVPLYLDPWAWNIWGGYSAPDAVAAMLLLVTTVAFAMTAGMWAALVDRADPARGIRHALLVRAAVMSLLAVLLVLESSRLASGGGVTQLVRTAIPLVALVAVSSTTLIERWRDLSGERVKRIREEQRAEMAAHLHDSVLQTLALIQNRAGASSEAARLARAQERELRAWLYDGDAPADSDLPTDLRDYAGALELDFPVRIDVVSAGASDERASGEVAAAAREAILNAARHAGGEISVYLEGTAASVDVYVRDRGPGFDPDAVPADRLGVRESIIGRMRRIGGSATIRPGGGGTGTEVHLRYAPGPGRVSSGQGRHG